MEINLGNLQFEPIGQHSDLIAAPVLKALANITGADAVGVAEIDPALSDTAAFCEHYRVGMHQAANCVVLEAKRGERTWYAACVLLASTWADVNGVVRKTLDARKVSFAQMEQAVRMSGMEFGASTPVGLPNDWSILIDAAVAESEYVIIGSGIRMSKLAVSGAFLASLPGATVIDGLAQPRV
jgi:prolyl-tRNA editing enzyme YbaK/EbsC (Cys-tRNA(Pro) deacylase)